MLHLARRLDSAGGRDPRRAGLRRATLLFIGAALLLAMPACRERDGAKTLKLAHSLSTEHPVHKAITFLARRVDELSDGTLRIDVYPGEQLGSEREAIELVQLGILAMTKTSTGPMEGFVPTMKVYGLPYLFRDDEHMWKVLEGPIGKRLLAAGTSKGLKGLCYYDAGARSFYTTHRPIHSPADLAGLKIRVQQSEMSRRMIEAMGGAPTPIDWGELYTSLQQGVVDGAENNPPSFYNSRHYETSKYYSLDEHLRVPDMLVISPTVWNDLSPKQQAILQQAVDESVQFQRRLWAETEAADLKAVQEAGVEIIRPDKQPFVDAVQLLWQEFSGTEVGQIAEEIRRVE
ncbi:MAG: TRAP transporter substrate-binding protein [Phycisphaerae bacterium]|jgi:tripartite ATP-independent transporter DctP family solute receptor